jgi:hypothetical protein
MTDWAYEIRITGSLDEHVQAKLRTRLGRVSITDEPASTLLSGVVADQAALVGVLDRLHDLGLRIHELRRVRDLFEHDHSGDRSSSADPGANHAI